MNTMLKDRELSGQTPNAEKNVLTRPEKRAEESNEKVRISLDISPELNDRLQAMARDIHGTKSDVLRKSLALMEAALQATKEGKKIGFADRSDQLTTEIIGLRY